MNEATSCDERKLSLPVPPVTGGEFGGGHAEPDDAGIAIACGAKRTHFPCLQKMCRRHYTTPREHSPWVGYFALLKFSDRWDVFALTLGTLGAIINGAGFPVLAIILGSVTNSIGLNQGNTQELESQVNQRVPYFIYLGIVSAGAAFCQGFFWSASSVRQVNRIRFLYLQRVLRQDITYYDTVGTSGYLMQGLNEDCITIQQAIGDKMGMFIFFISTFFSGITIAFVRGWDMTLVVLSLLPVMAAAGFGISIAISRVTNALNKAYADANTIALEALSNIRTVYAFNGESRTVVKYEEALRWPLKVGIQQGFLTGALMGIVHCVQFCAYALAMWYGGKRIVAGAYNGGEVLNVLLAALIGGFSLGQAAPNVQYIQQGKASGGRLFSIMEQTPEISIDSPGLQLDTVQGDMELRDVTFAYPTRPDVPIFSHFTLFIPAGKTVALVGESGCGKSSVIQLIERFYDPQQGTVLLDGIDIRKLQLSWFRSQLGLVNQEPTLFGTTIRENIRMGNPEASEADIEAAACTASAHIFISQLPLGYDTHVGERGVQISGGQKQRIAIARAIIKNPRVLLLDEATSALDAESEHVVQEALDQLMVGRTTLIVAHRLSTVVHSTSIAVIKNGRIVEQGSHEELMAKNGAYSTLILMQQAQSQLDSSFHLVTTNKAGIVHLQKVPEDDDRQGKMMPSDNVIGGELLSRGGLEGLYGLDLGMSPVAVKPPPVKTTRLHKIVVGLKSRMQKSSSTREQEQVARKRKVGLRRFYQLNKPELPAALFGLLGAGALGMIFPAFSFAMSALLSIFYQPADEIGGQIVKWSAVFVAIGFGSLIAALVESFSFNYMGQHLGNRIRLLLIRALLRQEVGWFDDEKNASGILTSKLSADALAVKGQFGDSMGLITQNLVTLLAGYIIAGISSWRMMLVITAVLPLLIAASVLHVHLVVSHVSKEEETFALANQAASEAFSAIRTICAFNMQDQMAELYKRNLEKPTSESRKRAWWAGLGFAFAQFIMYGLYSVAFWYMGLEISRGNSSFEDALRAFFAVFMAAFGFAQAQLYFPDVAKGSAATQRVFSVIDRTPLIDASFEGGIRLAECSGAIDIDQVTFSYPQRPAINVFEGFTLSIPAGSTVALVGESGSGKSTVISIVERFYDPQKGTVRLDGIDIRTLNLHWLRVQMGLVSQEPVVFNLSIADNIRYGYPDASLEKVIEAAKTAFADSFVSELHGGYNTQLGEGAVQLSGGQRQRIAIARAIIKNPRVLLLDEATSALDAESEHMVQEALDQLMVGRTTLIVAHRLSTVFHSTSIAVIHSGRIVEQGSHEELMVKHGAYSHLVARQMLGRE